MSLLPEAAAGDATLAANGFSLEPYVSRVDRIDAMPPWGRVVRTVGLLIESNGPRVSVGTMCDVVSSDGRNRLPVQVVGFRDGLMQAVPLGDTTGVQPGDRVVARAGALTIQVGQQLLGRVIDALGRPLDGLGPIRADHNYP